MRRLKNITTAREALQLPAAKETGLVGDEAHAAVLRCCFLLLLLKLNKEDLLGDGVSTLLQ